MNPPATACWWSPPGCCGADHRGAPLAARARTFLLNAAPLAFAGIAVPAAEPLRAARGAALRQWRRPRPSWRYRQPSPDVAVAGRSAVAEPQPPTGGRPRAAGQPRCTAAPDCNARRPVLHQRIEQDLRSGEPAAQLVPAEPPRTTRTGRNCAAALWADGAGRVAAPEEVDAARPNAPPRPGPVRCGWCGWTPAALRELLLAPPVLLVVLWSGSPCWSTGPVRGPGGRRLPVADLATT